MYRVAVVDDDERQASAVAALIDAASNGRFEKAVAISPTNPALFEHLRDLDVLIMDIDLGIEDATGVDVVRELAPVDAQVIYTSGYLEIVPQIYRTQHVGFISKPVDPAMLEEALARACDRLKEQRARAFTVKMGSEVVRLLPQRILYLESDRRRVHIYERGREVCIYAKLGDLEERLPDSFVRCHKSFLVNMAHITEFTRSEIHLVGGTAIPVSQRYATQARERFCEYVARAF